MDKSPEQRELFQKFSDQLISQRVKLRNESSAGPAIVVMRGKCSLVNCEISDCTGGGALVCNATNQIMELQLHIRGCTIRNWGRAGVEARESGNLLVESSEIHDNFQGAII